MVSDYLWKKSKDLWNSTKEQVSDKINPPSTLEKLARNTNQFFQRQYNNAWDSLSEPNKKELKEWGKAFSKALDDIALGILTGIDKLVELGESAVKNTNKFIKSLGGFCEAVVGMAKVINSKDPVAKQKAWNQYKKAKKEVSLSVRGIDRKKATSRAI